MKIENIVKLLNAKVVTSGSNFDIDITSAYTCDMLSLVMKNATANMALITIQTNLNVVAVSVLMEVPLIILAEGIRIEDKSLEKANEEDVVIIESELSAYEISGKLYQAGIPSVIIK